MFVYLIRGVFLGGWSRVACGCVGVAGVCVYLIRGVCVGAGIVLIMFMWELVLVCWPSL